MRTPPCFCCKMQPCKARQERVTEAQPVRVIQPSQKSSLLYCALCCFLTPVRPSYSVFCVVGLHFANCSGLPHQSPSQLHRKEDEPCTLSMYSEPRTSRASRDSCVRCRESEATSRTNETKPAFVLQAFDDDTLSRAARVSRASLTRTSVPPEKMDFSVEGSYEPSIKDVPPAVGRHNHAPAMEEKNGIGILVHQHIWRKAEAEGQLLHDPGNLDLGSKRPVHRSWPLSCVHTASLKEKCSPPLRAPEAPNNGVIKYAGGKLPERVGDHKFTLPENLASVANAWIEHVPQPRVSKQGNTGPLATAASAGTAPATQHTAFSPTKTAHLKHRRFERGKTSGSRPVAPLQISFAQEMSAEGPSLSRTPLLSHSVSSDKLLPKPIRTMSFPPPIKSRNPTLGSKEWSSVELQKQTYRKRRPSRKSAVGAEESERLTRVGAEAPQMRKSIGRDSIASAKDPPDLRAKTARSKAEMIVAHIEAKGTQPPPPPAHALGSSIFSYFCCFFGGFTTLGAFYVLYQLQAVTKELSGVKKALILTNEMPFIIV